MKQFCHPNHIMPLRRQWGWASPHYTLLASFLFMRTCYWASLDNELAQTSSHGLIKHLDPIQCNPNPNVTHHGQIWVNLPKMKFGSNNILPSHQAHWRWWNLQNKSELSNNSIIRLPDQYENSSIKVCDPVGSSDAGSADQRSPQAVSGT